MQLSPERRTYYPNLTPENYTVTSPETPAYNCIAWAYGIDNRRMWPAFEGYWWPDDVLNEESVEAFIDLFRSIGYEVCDSGDPEAGVEKVAIYAIADEPAHAARQLPSGMWASKLGQWEDIEHATALAVECSIYGKVTVFMARPSPMGLSSI